MTAAEDVQRQVAVAVEVAGEEASLLRAMQRVVGRVEVEHDLLRRHLVRRQEDLHQELVHGPGVQTDALVAIARSTVRPTQLQSVERPAPGQASPLVALASLAAL